MFPFMLMTKIHLYFSFLIISLLSFVIIRVCWLAKKIWETYPFCSVLWMNFCVMGIFYSLNCHEFSIVVSEFGSEKVK